VSERPRSYTATQTKLIKRRVHAYFYTKQEEARAYSYETGTPYRFSWKELADLIFDYTKVRMKGDTLRAIVEGQISRGRHRGGGPRNIAALASFLTHPDIKGLELEDLDEPEIPYLFAMQLLEFLRLDEDGELALPPATLGGAYRAVCRSDDGISDIFLEITLSHDGRLVHLEESSATYRNTNADPADLSDAEKKRHLWRQHKCKGWGVFTPEENIIGFMKRLSRYGGNQYYNLTANIPRLSSESPVQRLVLHAHDDPYFEDTYSERWLEEVHRDVLRHNLRNFVRVTDTDAEAEVP
jgi:hypothetical protein